MRNIYLKNIVPFCVLVMGLCFATSVMGQGIVTANYGSGTFDNENAWQLVNPATNELLACYTTGDTGADMQDVNTPVPGTTVEMRAWETFGDGWNGATVGLTAGSGGPVLVPQTTPTASNNDPLADFDCSGAPASIGVTVWQYTTIAVDCQITCPADVVSSTAPGTCSDSFVAVPMPTTSADCISSAVTVTIAGADFPLMFAGNQLQNTPFDIVGTFPTLAPGVTSVDIFVESFGDYGATTERPDIIGEDLSVLGIYISGTGDCATTVNGTTVTITDVQYAAWTADGVINLFLGPDTAVNSFCASEIVRGTIFPTIGFSSAINDYNGTDDASDIYPVGETEVCWTTIDALTMFPVVCCHNVTLADLEPPTMVCPGDATIHLDAGECNHAYSFVIEVDDNCGFQLPIVDIDGGVFGDISNCSFTGAGISCGLAGIGQIQEISTVGYPQNGLNITRGCFVYDNSAWGVTQSTINLYCDAPGLGSPPATPPNHLTGATPVATTGNVDFNALGAVNGTAVCVDFLTPYLYDASVCSGLYLEVLNANGAGTAVANGAIGGTTCNGISATGYNTYLATNACVPAEGYLCDIAAAFCGLDAFMALEGEDLNFSPVEPDPNGPTGYNEFESGDLLTIGENCFQYLVTDVNGNTTTCSWCVTVEEFPEANQTTTLSCNNHVNISVDESCGVVLTADMILEGGPYGCYESYNVTVSGVPGNAVSDNGTGAVTIDAAGIPGWSGMAGPFTISVSDPDNNNNSCWGTFMLEDKLAPTVTAEDVTIACVTPTAPGANVSGSLEADPNEYTPASLSWADGQTQLVGSVTQTLTGAPPGAKLTGMSLDVAMDHSWMGDITIDIVSPSGVSATVLAGGGPCANADNMDATFSLNGGAAACNVQATAGPHEDCPEDYLTATALSGNIQANALNDLIGESINGAWSVNFSDGTGGDGGCVHNVHLSATWTLPAATPAIADDNCNDPTLLNGRLTYKDATDADACAGDVITRTWVAVDLKGNSSSTVQTITVEPIPLSDITLPPALVELPGCGNGGSPDDIVSFYDLDTNGFGGPENDDNPNTDIIEFNEGHFYGYPSYLVGIHVQKVDNNVCSIYATYSDQTIPACDPSCGSAGSQKIIRTWTLLDWCTLDQATHVQVIKATDNEDPTVSGPDITVSTDPWSCKAFVTVPDPTLLHDNCTSDLTWTASGPAGWDVFGLDKSIDADGDGNLDPYVFTYYSTDCCGNQGSSTFNVIVADLAPPVAVAKQNIVVSLTAGQGQGALAGAKLFWDAVDNGSYDGCGNLKIEVRRPAGAPDCDNLGNFDHNNNTTFNNTFGQSNDNNNDTDNGDFVKFCCSDAVGFNDANGDYGEHQVIMRVYDDANMNGIPGDLGDNFNETWVTVRVENKLPPQINCTNVTLECWMDHNDYSMAPGPTTSGVCGEVSWVLINTIDQTGPCGDGIVIKNFGVDANDDGFVDGATCTQIITKTPSNDVFTGAIQWPGDVTTGCIQDTVVVAPMWNEGVCDLIGWTHIDEVFTIEADACWKVLRHYTVINWCTDETWEYTQTLKYVDNEAPTMTCTDQMFAGDAVDNNGDPLCGRFVTLNKTATDGAACPSEWFEWYVTVDLWDDNTIDWIFTSSQQAYVSNSDNILPLPRTGSVGLAIPELVTNSCYNHKVKYTVQDGCNNSFACTEYFMVVDKKAPTPYCISVASAPMENGQVTLWAVDFDLGAWDDCTAQEDLRFTFTDVLPADGSPAWNGGNSTSQTFTCADADPVTGDVEVQVYVWDTSCSTDGPNSASCYVTLNLQGCGTAVPRTIGGAVATELGESVEEVHMTSIAEEGVLNFPKSMMTDNTGGYAFMASTGFDYTVEGEKNDDYMNGVSTLDLVLIQKHILGLQALDSPYKMIAADINSSGSVSAIDLVELRKLILGIYSELPNNDSWRFVDASQTLETANPWNFNEVIGVNDLATDAMHEDFIAAKIGDVNGSVVANATSISSESRSGGALTLEVMETEMVAGQTTTIEFMSSNFADVYGYQFTMNLEGLTVNSVNAGSLDVTDANTAVIDNQLTMSYNTANMVTASNDEVLFTVNVTATQSGDLSNMISINSAITTAEAYIGGDIEVNNVNLAVRNDGEVKVLDTYALFQNEPNPFNGVTNISFVMAQDAQATISIFDVTGKVVRTVTNDYAKGYNTVSINKSDLGAAAGVLYYQLESGDFTATKKMIVIE